MSCTGNLDDFIPVDVDAPLVTVVDRPELIVLQALPTVVTTLVWLSLMVSRRRRGLSRGVTAVARGTAFVSSFALAPVAWRVVELYECTGDDAGSGEDSSAVSVWRILVASGVVLGAFVVTVPMSQRFPYLSIIVALLCAAGTVVADVGLRGWWTVTVAAVPLMYAQHLCNTIAALLFLTLPQRQRPGRLVSSSSRAKTSASTVVTVDALEARRSDVKPACPPSSTSWSWFS